MREGPFRAVWLAAVLSICVVWMQDVGSAWLMKRLTDGDPLMVGLVQAMAVLPVVLLAVLLVPPLPGRNDGAPACQPAGGRPLVRLAPCAA